MQVHMDQLWPSIIQKIDFQIVSHQIKAIIVPEINATNGLHELVFDGVTAFYWADKSRSYRHTGESEDVLPFEGFYYKPGKTQEVVLKENDKPDYPNFDTFPNFVLEMWEESILLIEAKAVIIDGRRFQVPEPIPFIPFV